MSFRLNIFSIYSTLILSIFFLFTPFSPLSAASLFISPSQGSYVVGQTFTVSVYANSSDQSMNALSGIVSFPAEKLSLVSISKTGSIVSLWVQEPSFSNTRGTATFEGIVLNPGYVGTAGRIISLTFRAKTTGTASLTFTNSSILANDGQGTSILDSTGTASFSIKESTVKEKKEEVVPEIPEIIPEALLAPRITEYPKSLEIGDIIKIKGSTSYPRVTVTIYIERDEKESWIYNVATDEKGEFSFTDTRSVTSGIYVIWAKITDSEKRESPPSEKISIPVSGEPFSLSGIFSNTALSLILLILLLTTLILMVYFWRMVTGFERQVHREEVVAEREIIRAFGVLRDEIKRQIEVLDTSPTLSAREKIIYQKLKEALLLAERYILRRVKNIDGRKMRGE